MTSDKTTLDKTTKAELTRQKIVDVALDLFRENGYEQTTMRLIAERAGVSTGNAYYYFASKEALIQGYYEGLLGQFVEKIEPVLANEVEFATRLTQVLRTWVDNARPYHEFAGSFFRFAAQPSSPLSPFSKESEMARTGSIDVYRRLIDGSEKLKMAPEVRERLPELLWMYQMGIVLYWVHDKSSLQAKTMMIIDRTAPLAARLVGLSRLPVMRGTARDLMELVNDLMTPHPPE